MQTFGAIEAYSDLNTPNLGKTILDRGKPYFWSRDWAKAKYNPSKLVYSYPAMLAIETVGEIITPFEKNKKHCYTVELNFLDKYDRACIDKKSNCKECSKRTRNEIFRDTEKFIKEFLDYLCSVVYVESTVDGITIGGWYHEEVFKLLQLPGIINPAYTRSFQRSMRQNNAQVAAIRWDGGLDDLYGTFIELRFCKETCIKTKFNPEPTNEKIGPDEGCC